MNKDKIIKLTSALIIAGGLMVACGPSDDSIEANDVNQGSALTTETTQPANDFAGTETGDAFGNSATNDLTADTDAGLLTDEETGADIAGTATDTNLTDANLNATADVATQSGEPVMIVINEDDNALVIEEVAGADNVAQVGAQNPEVTLMVGERYEIVFEGEGGVALQGKDDNILLASNEESGSLEANADIDFVESNNSMTFTVTEELAEQLAAYTVTSNPELSGSIRVDGVS